MADQQIVVYGHRDSVGNLGANDNGSSQPILIELARMLKGEKLRRTVEFVSLSQEEQLSSMGSHNYLLQHREDIPSIQASIEMDGVGGENLSLWTEGVFLDRFIKLHRGFAEYVKKTGWRWVTTSVKNIVSWVFPILDVSLPQGSPQCGLAPMGIGLTYTVTVIPSTNMIEIR